ncbi:hypothetical protein ACUM6W_14245 [Acinetobacter tandoii]|uniref:hypothetical protein n=1 Tax=Acinetobacter tandoii TaxID=202954 RepID=UPI0040460C2F
MNITKIIAGIIITFIFLALWAANASKTRNIDPECGFADGSEQCNGYLYAKYNQLKSIDQCDDDKNDPEMKINNIFIEGCESFLNEALEKSNP